MFQLNSKEKCHERSLGFLSFFLNLGTIRDQKCLRIMTRCITENYASKNATPTITAAKKISEINSEDITKNPEFKVEKQKSLL